MQFVKGKSLKYKGYTFEHYYCYNHYRILVTSDMCNAEFYQCCVMFNNGIYYDMPDIASKIPGLVCENKSWIFPDIIDLSNVADEMIRLIEVYYEMQTSIEDIMANSFASKIKSARK